MFRKRKMKKIIRMKNQEVVIMKCNICKKAISQHSVESANMCPECFEYYQKNFLDGLTKSGKRKYNLKRKPAYKIRFNKSFFRCVYWLKNKYDDEFRVSGTKLRTTKEVSNVMLLRAKSLKEKDWLENPNFRGSPTRLSLLKDVKLIE